MNTDDVVTRKGFNLGIGLKLLPLVVLAMIWLWILLIVLIVGLDTSVFHSAFGWTAMIPHL